MFIPSDEKAAFVRMLVDAMTEIPFGGFISHDEIEEVLGFDVRKDPTILASARTKLNRETGSVIRNVRGKGYTRLTAEQYAASIAAVRTKIRRQARRTVRTFKFAIAKTTNIPPNELANVGREMAIMGLISHISRDSVIRKVAASGPPSPGATVRAMLAAMNGGEDDASAA